MKGSPCARKIIWVNIRVDRWIREYVGRNMRKGIILNNAIAAGTTRFGNDREWGGLKGANEIFNFLSSEWTNVSSLLKSPDEMSSDSQLFGLYGVSALSFLCSRTCLSSMGWNSTTRVEMSSIMGAVVATVDSLPIAAYRFAIPHGENSPDVWAKGVKGVVPGLSSFALDDSVWILSKTHSTCREDASACACTKILTSSLGLIAMLGGCWMLAWVSGVSLLGCGTDLLISLQWTM